MTDILPNQRHLFDLEDKGITYLNCAQVAPFLKSVKQAGYDGIEDHSKPWHITSESFFKDAHVVRKCFADLVRASPEQIALISSASYGMAIAAKNVAFEKGQNILSLEEEFPSNYYAWKQLADRKGGEVRIVKRPVDSNWTPAILNAIDSKTAVVAVPNCHWTDGSLVDLVALRKGLGNAGPALVVDATQSLGAYPFDVNTVKPAFLINATYKWLLGPYTYGMLYVDEKYLNGEPIEYNWINRKGSEDFSKLVEYQDDFQPGARRFDFGEKSNAILVPMVIAALRQLLDWQISRINSTIRRLTDILAQEAPSIGATVVDAPYRAGHMIGLRRQERWPDALRKSLFDQQIYVSFRGNSIRVSPHVYNSEDDIARLIDAIKRFA